jgi:hypothetical protein
MNPYPWNPDQDTPADRVVDVIIYAICLLLVYMPVYFLLGIRTDSTCIVSQQIVEMTPVGDSYGSTYFIRGEGGALDESEEPKRVGDPYCFEESSRIYYKLRPFFAPWEES